MTDDRPDAMSGLTFYDRNAAVYMQTHAAYHDQRFRTFNMLVPAPPGALFDFGCGSADNLIPLARRGFSIRGVDPSPNLIELGKTALRDAGLDAGAIAVGDVAALEAARPGSLDVVTALNVLAYLTQEEEDRFFRASARALKSTGALCFSVGNLLSDLVTLNRYTVEFYERHVLGSFAETDEEAREYSGQLRALLTNAALPAKTTDASYAGRVSSERDIVKTRRVDSHRVHREARADVRLRGRGRQLLPLLAPAPPGAPADRASTRAAAAIRRDRARQPAGRRLRVPDQPPGAASRSMTSSTRSLLRVSSNPTKRSM